MLDQWRLELNNFLVEASKSLEFELFDLIIRRQGKLIYIEVIVDKETGGITLDECSKVNKHLSRFLEEKNLIAEDYVVEVSSPGLDRPLKSKRDFIRVKGKAIRLHLNELIEGKKEHSGIVKEVNDDSVNVETKKNTVVVPLIKIQKAVLIIE